MKTNQHPCLEDARTQHREVMTTLQQRLPPRKRKIFNSVFPLSKLEATTPTPVATPDQGFTAPGQPFGGPNNAYSSLQIPSSPSSALASEQIRWSRAWHTATSFLSLQDEAIAVVGSDMPLQLARWDFDRDSDVENALLYLLSPSSGRKQRLTAEDQNLQEWYSNEVRRHYLTHLRKGLVKVR